ncbi:MAG: response regulator transcription factor [Acidimicrobiales bacterium]|nr:response regulator transcription factor [Acidimicrobiales bacterium]
MTAPRILVVEDDATIGRGIVRALGGEGYHVELAPDGHGALAIIEQDWDLVLLDLGLPDVDGLEVCRRLRVDHPLLPIVMLTARTDEIDVVAGLDAGADDYITKPFRVAELFARVRARLREPSASDETSDRIVLGDVAVDLAARRAWRDSVELDLRPKEFDLLRLLVTQAGRALTRERIMEEVWDEHWFGSTKTLDMHVSSLRRKLVPAGGPDPITTLRGVGYRYELP